MTGIFSSVTDPAVNLATEEYLLKNRTEDIFYLYVNDPSIIVGKHQNTLAEIDYNFIRKNNIPVYRRLSGGGTVYHDHGNLNFCFITNEEKGNLVNFGKYTRPVVEALEKLGLKITVGERHDLSINGEKITGTASHVFRNRAMHHGTLLFSADLTVLNKCLKAGYQQFKSKGVRSVRSKVTNISDHLRKPMTMTEFQEYIFNSLAEYYKDTVRHKLTNEEMKIIGYLVKEKYSNWEWNYGYSPKYEFTRKVSIKGARVTSEVTVEKGIISDIGFSSDNKKLYDALNELARKLTGIQHEKSMVTGVSENLLPDIPKEDILSLLF